eukprot:m.337008 g.337008  ORF g.337008 m.337008 type:complete len:53 (+) comp16079_c0_seq1:5115-5273(+)
MPMNVSLTTRRLHCTVFTHYKHLYSRESPNLVAVKCTGLAAAYLSHPAQVFV